MSEHIMGIAARIRELREISDITIEEMANNLNVSVETYEAYETGLIDIPISVLIAISECFNVEVGALLTGGDPRLVMYSVTRAGKGVDMAHSFGYKYQSLAYNFSGKVAEPFQVTIEPNQTNTPISQNAHSGQEFDFVIEGTLRVVINDNEIILNAGDCIYFNSIYPHGMEAYGDKPAKFLAIVL
ncbi:MAG: helix-turn-helix transcriptional regulator [Clostridia bacterium]|nr:helix-turn-helix transcriptional regulator [Clostridia bacterium]MBQ4638099.1 helix-turn-helix transcriptional regulator [Clostridia bacterium]